MHDRNLRVLLMETIKVDNAALYVAEAEREPRTLPDALNKADGILVLKGMCAVSDEPGLLVRLSSVFGCEVEDYALTSNRHNLLHWASSQIIRISNLPPMNFAPPARPDPPLTPDGRLPIQFPHRRGWHTDQSFRRPPPDISLFYAHRPAPRGQGQTLFANGTQAYAALSPSLKERTANLMGIHVAPFKRHGEDDVRAGVPPDVLNERDGPQLQPVVRKHPETGRNALYLCEREQMDWVHGPFAGMKPGVDGEAAELLYEIMSHYTAPDFTYAHDWEQGDLVIYDNRCTIHCATWFDAEKHGRDMWRTTVWGNPGSFYEGEVRSWET